MLKGVQFYNDCEDISSIHCLNGNICQIKGIFQGGALSLPEQAASGLKLCSCFGRAYFALLPLSPYCGESGGDDPHQRNFHVASQINILCEDFGWGYFEIVAL